MEAGARHRLTALVVEAEALRRLKASEVEAEVEGHRLMVEEVVVERVDLQKEVEV